jgi:hypothetical protein
VSVGSCNIPCASLTAINLTPGSTYRFRVVAVNAVGEGARSPLSNSITLPQRGSTTTVVSSANPSAYAQAITFTATVSVAGGAPLAGGGVMLFRADSNTIAGCAAVPVTLVAGSNVASCTTNTLGVQNWNISATFSGDAQTSFSFGQVIQTVNATTPGSLSSINTATSAPNGIGQITFTFTAPANDGGSPITSYTARCTNTITNQVVSQTQFALSLTLSPVTVGQPYNCAVFASNAVGDGPAATGGAIAFAALNIDGSTATVYDAATDGVMILRYLAGIRGDAISEGVIGATATRNAAQIATYLESIKTQLDIDGDGVLNAATDGLLIVRYMRSGAVSASYILNAFNPSGVRNNEDDITFWLGRMMQ